MIQKIFGVVALACLLTGCDENVPVQAQQAQQAANAKRETELMDDYYEADIKKAEESLLALSKQYQEAQKTGAETRNYDSLLMLTHARLYLVYAHQRRTNEAAMQREEALRYMRHSAIYTGAGSKDSSASDGRWAELIEMIERLDKNRAVKWKETAAK